MGPLKDLIDSLPDNLDPDILYEDKLRSGGFHTLRSIWDANSAEQVAVACDLRFGEANVIWNFLAAFKAACAGHTGKQSLTAFKAIEPQSMKPDVSV